MDITKQPHFDNLDVTNLNVGGVAVTPTAAQLNSLGSAVGTVAYDRSTKIAKVALAGATIHAGVQAWVNPEAVSIIVARVWVDVTTIATGAGTLSVGTTAVSITTASANLIDTVDVHVAAALDNITNPGTLGKSRQKLAAAKWVTFGEASGDVTGLAGNLYIEYFLI